MLLPGAVMVEFMNADHNYALGGMSGGFTHTWIHSPTYAGP
ncbi:MAG: hypothetical protein RL254_1745, partial [Planctomycetota bacterium]